MEKILTRDQAQTSKDRAARFVLNVLQDPDTAQAIQDESVDDWVERKKITLTNPGGRYPRRVCLEIQERKVDMAKKSVAEQLEELTAENEDLRAENEDLRDQLDQVADIVAGGDDEDEDDGEDEREV